MGLFSYFNPCNNHQELREKQASASVSDKVYRPVSATCTLLPGISVSNPGYSGLSLEVYTQISVSNKVYEDLPATCTFVHCTPMYQSVTWDIHLECTDIPEHRSATKYTKTCQLHCTLFPGVSVSNPGYNRLSPGMFHSILCRWPIFTGLHFRWQASIHQLTDWYTREQCSLLHTLCCWPIFLYTLQVTGHYTQVTD